MYSGNTYTVLILYVEMACIEVGSVDKSNLRVKEWEIRWKFARVKNGWLY